MYPYPQPYPGTAYVQPPPQPRTPSGLRWSLVGIALIIGYFATTALVGVALGGVLASFQPTMVDAFLAAVGALLLATVLVLILGILVLIFYFIGFGFLYAGRNEFGPGHARNLQISLILMILAVVIGVVQVATVWILNGSAIRPTGGGGFVLDPGMFYTAAVANAILGITIAALVAAHFVLNVRALVAPRHDFVLYVAAALGTATPGVVGSLTLLQLPQYIRVMEAVVESQSGAVLLPSVDPAISLPLILAGALGAATFLLYLWAYRGAVVRIRTGEIKAIPLPPAPVTPWAPMYPMAPAAFPPPPPAQPPASR